MANMSGSIFRNFNSIVFEIEFLKYGNVSFWRGVHFGRVKEKITLYIRLFYSQEIIRVLD